MSGNRPIWMGFASPYYTRSELGPMSLSKGHILETRCAPAGPAPTHRMWASSFIGQIHDKASDQPESLR